MIVAEQVGLPRLVDHGIEKQSPHFMFHQALAVLAKHRRIETLFLYLHVQKPAKQQVITQLLAELPLASDRIQRDEQQRFENPLGAIDGRPTGEYIRLNTRDNATSR